MNAFRCVTLSICIILLACSCQSTPKSHSRKGVVQHVVVCWLKNSGNEADREKVIEASRRLRKIPGVTSTSVGQVLPGTRPIVDSTFDVALIVTFTDVQALRDYDMHPIHQEVVSEVVKPMVEKLIIYDFIQE